VVVAPLVGLLNDCGQLKESICKADLRGAGVIGGSQLSTNIDIEARVGLFESRLVSIVNCFDGDADLADLWVGKLKDEGGAPRLGHTASNLLDLALMSSLMLAGAPARLSLIPTVSTFAQPC